jgi:hypothetical protein
LSKSTLIYFIHGTHIDGRIWNNLIIKEIQKIFGSNNPSKTQLLQWCGTNSTLAREKAGDELIELVSQDLKNIKPEAITIVGHSHGGTIALMKSAELFSMFSKTNTINIVTINTPCIAGGPRLFDSKINHYNIISKGDKIVPIAGFNKTGLINEVISNKTLWQKLKYGEFSYRRSVDTEVLGSIISVFPSANNIFYKDQYWMKGLNPKTHFTRHRGYLERNVNNWIPQLKKAYSENENRE